MSRAEIKQRAKAQLGGSLFSSNWLLALLVVLILSAINGIAAGFTFGIAAIIIFGPLQYGVSYLFLKQARDGKEMSIGDLFKGFSDDFGQTLLIGLLSSIFIVLWSMLFFIPGIVKAYAYSMAYFIKVDNPSYDWKQCINTSKEITKGHKGELFVLDLSFIGWLIVGSLCFGIGTLWVAPYMFASKAQFYETIKPVAAQQQYAPQAQQYAQPAQGYAPPANGPQQF